MGVSRRSDKAVFEVFLGWARQYYRDVYFIGGGGTDLLSQKVAVEAVASERFQIPEYESLRNAYPTRVRFKEFDFGLIVRLACNEVVKAKAIFARA